MRTLLLVLPLSWRAGIVWAAVPIILNPKPSKSETLGLSGPGLGAFAGRRPSSRLENVRQEQKVAVVHLTGGGAIVPVLVICSCR